jgi:hypothetical protein
MKAISALLFVSILLISIGCGGSKSVKGTWELISPAPEDPLMRKSVKILSDTHFAFGTLGEKGGIFAGGGTYTFGDSTYTEFIQYHAISFLVGQRMEFKCILDDDRWYHSGVFDIDGRKFTVNEVWRRVDE